jgi:hypothetical protein
MAILAGRKSGKSLGKSGLVDRILRRSNKRKQNFSEGVLKTFLF